MALARGVCKHCGDPHDVVTAAGKPGTVCLACRAKQRQTAPLARTKIKMRSGDGASSAAAIERAHRRAQDDNISLVAALKIEGVI